MLETFINSNKSAGFLGIRSTDATRALFKLYVETYSNKLGAYKGHKGMIGDIGEQHTMTPLLQKSRLPVRWLNQCESSNGKWYKGVDTKRPVPMVIQNNLIIGNDAKIYRAKKFKQLFLDDQGLCR